MGCPEDTFDTETTVTTRRKNCDFRSLRGRRPRRPSPGRAISQKKNPSSCSQAYCVVLNSIRVFPVRVPCGPTIILFTSVLMGCVFLACLATCVDRAILNGPTLPPCLSDLFFIFLVCFAQVLLYPVTFSCMFRAFSLYGIVVVRFRSVSTKKPPEPHETQPQNPKTPKPQNPTVK